MSEGEPWRPLDVETEEQEIAYDALGDGLPSQVATQFWEWVRDALRGNYWDPYLETNTAGLRVDLAEEAAQRLGIEMASVRVSSTYERRPGDTTRIAVSALQRVPNPLAVADFLLAHSPEPYAHRLEAMLRRSRSLWTVGTRRGHLGLVRRLPETVQDQTDRAVRGAGPAGAKLAQAWEATYGVTPDPTKAYVLAIRAVEDAAIPVVVPKQDLATLGHVQGRMKADGDWGLAFTRHPEKVPAPEGGIPLALVAALWTGQHDRHGGEPSAPGNVSQEEAEAAVSFAVSLVHWFSTGMVARR